MRSDIEEIIDLLHKAAKRPNAVVMPDFFVDRFVSFLGSVEELVDEISTVAKQGGGNIPRTEQIIMRGGNASNTASALASLDARVHLIARTSSIGHQLLEHYLGGKVDLAPVKVNGKLALTVALEVLYHGKRVNIMLNDPGSVADFHFDALTESDLSLVEAVDYVCIFNWNQNRYGTELARGVFEHVRKHGRGKRFFDTGDPYPKKDEIRELMETLLERRMVDILSINENEAMWYASYFDESVKSKREATRPEPLAMECARILHDNLKMIIDLHMADYSFSIVDKGEYMAPAFDVPVKRTTGAGDAWNAADIYSHAIDLPHLYRLFFANAYAAHYISNPGGWHPSKEDTIEFLKTARKKKVPHLKQ